MKRKFDQVYQFKVILKGVKPPVWRRIQVPETYTFWDLHVAVQDAMGWDDYHLHQFEIIDPRYGDKRNIGIPDEDDDYYNKTLAGWRQKIVDWFSPVNAAADYMYDFGDGWEHKITFEKIVTREKDTKYPVCIGGKRACPPEDCGGDCGYENLLEIISNPNHEEYKEMTEWLSGDFDPEYFNSEEVIFDDPAKRFKLAFEQTV